MNDLIERQKAIEVIEEMQMPIMRSMFPEEQFVFKGMSEALSAIKDLPSAQPKIEERKEESAQNVPKEDLISRNAAIEAECEVCQIAPKKERGHNCTYYVHGCKEIECLRELPSAQPERLTDDDFETIRIHLNAYKEKLCNQGRWKEAVKYQNIIDRFMSFASAQPMPQWIPVSEKLPGENEFVLVTFGWFGRKTDPGVNIDVIRDGDWMISEVVTAWMPLPEPYRAERRTDAV